MNINLHLSSMGMHPYRLSVGFRKVLVSSRKNLISTNVISDSFFEEISCKYSLVQETEPGGKRKSQQASIMFISHK